MPRFSVSLSMLFGERPFLERFAACKKAGFNYVEYMFPYDYPPQILREHLQQNNLKQILFNLPAGDWPAGDRGIAADPSRIEEFHQGVDRALEYARVLGVDRINCLVGKRIEGVADKQLWRVLLQNLKYATKKLSCENRMLLVEPVNTYDIPDFFLSTTKDAARLIDEVGAENLKLQCDVYHMQRMEGEITGTIKSNLKSIGHIQIADNPGRHQPGTGEINYRFILNELDQIGYDGFVGLEYAPSADTVSSFEWIKKYGFEL